MKNKIYKNLLILEKNISKNNYLGFDPYDIKGNFIYIWALSLSRTGFFNNILRKLVLAPLLIGELYFPLFYRLLFRVKPSLNAKGISLITRAYLNLYKKTKNKIWLDKATILLNWLEENKSKGYSNSCWGYPFDWYSGGGLVPAFTPAAVVSSAAFDAFWDAWLLTDNDTYLETCRSICSFFLEELNISYADNNTICFSYTPLDKLQVHNINLMIADCLLRVGYKDNNKILKDVGNKAVNYAIREQNIDGSLFYYGRSQNYIDPNRIDHYHSGFEMRSLFGIWKTTKNPVYKDALKKYYNYYINNLIRKDDSFAFPLMYPGEEYPINIHTYAEAILLNSTLTEIFPEAVELAQLIMPIVLKRMKKDNGDFRYMIRKIGPFYYNIDISYMRWGQAWMFLALSQFLLVDD